MGSEKIIAEKIGINESYLLNIAKNHNKFYKSYYIKKKSGDKRPIDSPNRELKAIQGFILRNILEDIPVSERAQGFIRGRSIKSNARFHLRKRYILCLDIEDFFPSINENAVYNIFNNIYRDENIAKLLTNLCTYKRKVPQGAVTSPMLSNIVFHDYDKKIDSICKRKRIRYSRYADDLTFSSNNFLLLKELIPNIKNILSESGFRLNKRKTRYLTAKGKMIVTGVILNSSRLTTGRSRKRRIRAELHNYIVKGKKNINLNRIAGEISFIRDIEPDYLKKIKDYQRKLKGKKKRKGKEKSSKTKK
ncbi:MAG TPA: retron St85 family RNA-directed DNA polymerase [Candidatus Glassbacteria bacterium]|nr:retron St85 family RNA-directed DNA polymerase [Candidatus Glassbacteria bacterium]